MKKTISNIIIYKETTISEVLKQMDAVQRKLLIILNDDDTFFSLISIGDLQRAIIANSPLNTPIYNIVRNDIVVASDTEDLNKVKERMRVRRNEFMPVLNSDNKVVDVIFWEDLFEEKKKKKKIGLPVVIMAGGRGSRLKPLTNVLPKPLIPIHEKTIIEDIMDCFVEYECHSFFISVNYKADMIKYYFDSLKNPNYNISYFQEPKPLGTAGSLALLKGKVNSTFFVSNCDILIDEDYAEILNFHQTQKNEITLVAVMKHFTIPYGTLETGNNGKLLQLKEKPDLHFKINSGVYIIEPHLLDEIPDNVLFHITELIENVLKRNGKVGVFPVNETSWKDMGSLDEYKFQ